LSELVGRSIGRYDVQEEIGHGGMARVYRAFDTQLQRTIALKVMALQLGIDPEFAQRFKREAVLAANLQHPSIVTIYDQGEFDGLHYIAMEYVQGQSLHDILKERGALGLDYTLAIVTPLGDALDYAHTQGAVHRDVKPHNVLIDVTGRVMLADFGIVQPPDADKERLTRTGMFMGTPEYISPEQAQGQRVTGQSDLYSLAIVIYQMLIGQVPFTGSTFELIQAHVQAIPPNLNDIAPHLPRELNLVLSRALAKKPSERFQTGAALTEALSIVARRHQVTVPGRSNIATLATPASSAGRSTIAVDLNKTPIGSRPPALAQPNVQLPPKTSLKQEDLDALRLSQQPTSPAPAPVRSRVPPSAGPPRTPPPPPPGGWDVSTQMPDGSGGARLGFRTMALLLGMFVTAVVLLVGFIGYNLVAGGEPDRGPAAVVTETVTATEEPPTPITPDVPTAEPTETSPADTPVPSDTPVQPQEPPTDTPAPPPPVPPTDTPVPPSATPAPPTNTPAPPPTLEPLPTDTPVPPTATEEPTATEVPPTDTPVPPTATEEPTATEVPPTDTPVPPTATEEPPTLTPTFTPTLTPTVTVTPTPTDVAGARLRAPGQTIPLPEGFTDALASVAFRQTILVEPVLQARTFV
jgi:serine/threonine-protein kinase